VGLVHELGLGPVWVGVEERAETVDLSIAEINELVHEARGTDE